MDGGNAENAGAVFGLPAQSRFRGDDGSFRLVQSILKCPWEGLDKLLLVIPAKAGIQLFQQVERELDSSFRWDDSFIQRFPCVPVSFYGCS